jgi:hypothetical protein
MNRYNHEISLRVMSAAFGYAGKEKLKSIKSHSVMTGVGDATGVAPPDTVPVIWAHPMGSAIESSFAGYG